MSVAGIALFVVGCGGRTYSVAPAKGKVICNDKPISMGSVVFEPVGEPGDSEPGKPAIASIDADGTFILTTYQPGDGAIVGKHRVTYFAPEGNEDEDETPVEEGSEEEKRRNAERAKKQRALTFSPCVQKGEILVEVTADGENDFTIDLVPDAE